MARYTATIAKNEEAIKEYLQGLSDSELVNINNIYSQSNNYEDEIYENDSEFFDTYFSNDAMKAVRAAHYGAYSPNEKYVQFNGQANLVSFNEPIDQMELNDIVAHILDNAHLYDIELEEEESEETEEEETV